MKTIGLMFLLTTGLFCQAQSVVGTWQLVEEKTCFAQQLPATDTEKELLKDMGASRSSVARTIRFDKKGGGEEGVFSAGEKKGSSMNSFRYLVTGRDLQLLDKKSGMMTDQFIIDEISASTLVIHRAQKDCESRKFTRIK